MHGRMPVEAAVEGGVQGARTEKVGRPVDHVIQLVGVLTADAAQGQFREVAALFGGKRHAMHRLSEARAGSSTIERR